MLYVGATGLELLVRLVDHHPHIALWIDGLFPALVAVFYVQQVYIKMGD